MSSGCFSIFKRHFVKDLIDLNVKDYFPLYFDNTFTRGYKEDDKITCGKRFNFSWWSKPNQLVKGYAGSVEDLIFERIYRDINENKSLRGLTKSQTLFLLKEIERSIAAHILYAPQMYGGMFNVVADNNKRHIIIKPEYKPHTIPLEYYIIFIRGLENEFLVLKKIATRVLSYNMSYHLEKMMHNLPW